ncbi:coniferyl aldehyde dehydrogenase [Ramlibacter sp. AN1015]|uniref:coniferyl aldehyde dehydrogenase n=1 Tax=Ramlibacter sp. AN1015 TaxID=3133428 RepID=UPI0030BCEFD6
MAAPPETPPEDALRARFDLLHRASRAQLEVPLAVRERRLERLAALVREHVDALAQAISDDFGHRSRHETLLLEALPTLEAIGHARKRLARWMRPQRRPVSTWSRPAQARLIPQPLGLAGIIVPWNYPLLLACSPLCAALAAGNRAMVKMSEYTPRTGALFAELVRRHFDEDELWVVNGGPEVGAAFAALPFDHLLFTGSTSVGRRVMRAAADNLTPVTLELGGKSPAIVAPGYPLHKAAERIMAGKLYNAGQTCVAPDYALVPRGQEQAFLEAARAVVQRLHPDIAHTPHYSSIVNDRHFERLQELVQDAGARGARVVPLSQASADPAGRRFPPVALTGLDDAMRVMQDEIFGPILPVLPYDDIAHAVEHVNAHPRPLALYLFDNERERIEQVLRGTVAGGVCVNDTLVHLGQEELPFGGVGPSGMGQYHGEEGFRTFSKMKGVFLQSRVNALSLFNPPYGRLTDLLARLLLR